MAQVVAFRAEYGMSVELKGQWFRFYSAIEVRPDEGENTEEVKAKAWNTVTQEVEKQVEAVVAEFGNR